MQHLTYLKHFNSHTNGWTGGWGLMYSSLIGRRLVCSSLIGWFCCVSSTDHVTPIIDDVIEGMSQLMNRTKLSDGLDILCVFINHRDFFRYYLSSAGCVNVCVCIYVCYCDCSHTVQPTALKLWHNTPHVTA